MGSIEALVFVILIMLRSEVFHPDAEVCRFREVKC